MLTVRRKMARGAVGLSVTLIAAGMLTGGVARAQEEPELETDARKNAPELDPLPDGPTAPGAEVELKEQASTPTSKPSPKFYPRFSAKVRAGAGAIDGEATVPGKGAMTVVEADLTPSVRRRGFELAAPISLAHRQTFGTSLSETRADGTARASYRFQRSVRLAGELGLDFINRPDWADPFQNVAGVVTPTNRYSHWDRRAALELVAANQTGTNQLTVRYDYELQVYRRDPTWDAIYDPVHLAPWDQDTHRIDTAYRRQGDGWNATLGTEVGERHYFFRFAGDPETGITHAGSVLQPANPLLELRWAKPRVEFAVKRWGDVNFGAGYELELMKDVFAGYLSYVGHHPDFFLTWWLPHGARLTARAEVYLRRYGASSYGAPYALPNHPPLASGTRRYDRLGLASLLFRLPLGRSWAAIAEGELAVRRTNYDYAIAWNYTTSMAWAGAEYTY